MSDRIVAPARIDEDVQYEAGLRPRSLDDYIGQDRIRENLQVAIAAARNRGEALDHALLYGPPGLGKTTLATVIANELGVSIRSTAGPVIERPGDLAAILTALGEREVLFIDEIHRLAPAIEEILYPAMEDYELDVMIGQGPGARSMKVMPPFVRLTNPFCCKMRSRTSSRVTLFSCKVIFPLTLSLISIFWPLASASTFNTSRTSMSMNFSVSFSPV